MIATACTNDLSNKWMNFVPIRFSYMLLDNEEGFSSKKSFVCLNQQEFAEKAPLTSQLLSQLGKTREKHSITYFTGTFFYSRLYWDLMILSLLIVNMFVLPVAIAFFNDDLSPSWIGFNGVSDGAFLLDILLNFRTGVIVLGTPNKFILDPKQIAVRWVKMSF